MYNTKKAAVETRSSSTLDLSCRTKFTSRSKSRPYLGLKLNSPSFFHKMLTVKQRSCFISRNSQGQGLYCMMSLRVLELVDTHDNIRVGSQVCDGRHLVYWTTTDTGYSDIAYRNTVQPTGRNQSRSINNLILKAVVDLNFYQLQE